MEFWSLLMVASMPVLQVLLVGLLGAFLASGYINILSANARSDINKGGGISTVPLRAAYTVYSAPCHEYYWYNDTIIRCMPRRMLGNIPLDLHALLPWHSQFGR
ncbi:hypothetical protein OPV22_003802 [Ensete ventricosum]|uniref:Uncharacterized protein n=1 Tax=Ensete ventricosum TaxID=4639 RepID=A0AAV8S1W4_ENSVE|nr:hypothetical protein OPV22_003802 [Ensete ventricosum]